MRLSVKLRCQRVRQTQSFDNLQLDWSAFSPKIATLNRYTLHPTELSMDRIHLFVLAFVWDGLRRAQHRLISRVLTAGYIGIKSGIATERAPLIFLMSKHTLMRSNRRRLGALVWGVVLRIVFIGLCWMAWISFNCVRQIVSKVHSWKTDQRSAQERLNNLAIASNLSNIVYDSVWFSLVSLSFYGLFELNTPHAFHMEGFPLRAFNPLGVTCRQSGMLIKPVNNSLN